MDDPFVVSVDQWIGSARRKQDLVLQAIAQDALARVKQLTPVDTGMLRASWTIVANGQELPIAAAGTPRPSSSGTPRPSSSGTPRPSSSGTAPTDRSQQSLQAILTLKGGDSFSLVNPVIYCRRIEFGFVGEDSLGRHYDQKGVGMMQQTIAEMPQIAAAAAARVARLP